MPAKLKPGKGQALKNLAGMGCAGCFIATPSWVFPQYRHSS